MFLSFAFALLAASPEDQAVAHLAREVPAWFRENKCYSCHNNGDGARALYVASRKGRAVPPAALQDTTNWLSAPAKWESNHGDPVLSDKKLSRIQFAAALGELPGSESALSEAAAMLVRDQLPDGSWAGDSGSPAGSPVTYNSALATYMARRVLLEAGERFAEFARRAAGYLGKKQVANVPDAAAVALALRSARALTYLSAAQNTDGGWGPAPRTPSEAFDTALAMLALRAHDRPAVARGRAWLISRQLQSGGWPETTRPSGGQSYAQHISTTAWALIALLETAPPESPR